MHKRRQTVPPAVALPPKARHNRKRRDWNRVIRRICGVALLAEMVVLLFVNPHFEVTHVRINGLQTLPAAQVFAEARVPARTNIFWMALRQPFVARLAQDPAIDHVTRTIALPRTLVLNVTERRPFAVLADGQDLWLMDVKGVPYRRLASPPPGVPLLEWSGTPAPSLTPGRALADPRLAEAYALMALLRDKKNLGAEEIKVDQNANLCLNRSDHLQIRLGQPDALPQKIALAQAALEWHGGDLARHASCIDVSCPQQPVMTQRVAADDAGGGGSSETDGH